MKKLIPFIKLFSNQSKWLLLSILLSWSAVLMSISLMSLSGWFISYAGYLATTAYAISNSFNYFYPAAGVRCFSLIRILSRYGEKIFAHEATFRILTEIRVWIYNKIEPITPIHLSKYKTGDLLSRLINDVSALDNLYIRILLPSVVFIISSLTATILFCFLSTKLAFIVLMLVLCTGFFIPLISHKIASNESYMFNENISKLKTQIIENVSSLAEIKIFDLEDNYLNMIKQQNLNLINNEARLSVITGLGSAMINLFIGVTVIIATLICLSLVQNCLINGAFIALIYLAIIALFESIIPMQIAYQYLGKTLSAVTRILQITNSKSKILFNNKQDTKLKSYDIEFKDVNFGYTSNQKILNNFNLKIKNKDKVALFASTGLGKSTIINLLIKFWDIDQGDITIGNHSISSLTEQQIRNSMTVINQYPYIFSGSIKKNLILANTEATDKMIWEALDKVQMKEYVASLTNTLNTWIGNNGQHLSGGQQKRIALARAFLQNKPILLLDEPTEGLDHETEEAIFKNLQKLMINRTTVFITHNNKLLASFDKIIKL